MMIDTCNSVINVFSILKVYRNTINDDASTQQSGEEINEIENLEVSLASRDLILRLLEKNPQHRLKSLLALKRIAFFHNFNFEDIRQMKVSKNNVL